MIKVESLCGVAFVIVIFLSLAILIGIARGLHTGFWRTDRQRRGGAKAYSALAMRCASAKNRKMHVTLTSS